MLMHPAVSRWKISSPINLATAGCMYVYSRKKENDKEREGEDHKEREDFE